MPEKPITGRKRRISSRYLPHLADIAAIFLECDRHVEPTTRRVQDELGLPLTPNTLRNWTRRSAEFRAALEDAEIIAADAAKADPEVRSPRDIAWFQAKIAELRDLHDNGELTDKERAAIRREIRDLTAAVRAEEAHIGNLRDRKASRDFGRFLKNLVDWIKTSYPRRADVVAPILRQALKSLSVIMRGKR